MIVGTACVALALLPTLAIATQPDYYDSFERENLGPAWHVTDGNVYADGEHMVP